jgi:hypothetical protein
MRLSELYGDDFKSVVQTVTHTARSWGTKPEFHKKNILQRVRHFDEVANASRLNELGKSFEISFFQYLTSHDTYTTKRSFLGLQSVVNVFSCLLPQQMLSYTDDELSDAATNLANLP